MRNLLLKILNYCRRRPVLWTFLGATSALLAGAIIFITPWIEGELKRRLPALVYTQTQGNYTLEIVDIDLDLWRLNIEIQNVSLNFDTTRLASLPDTAWAINARLPALNLSLGNPLSWILHQHLFIAFIGIDNLRVQVIQQGRSNTPWSAKRLRAMLQNILKKSLSSLTIEKIKWEFSQTILPGKGRLLHPFTVVANGFSITKAGTPKLAQIQVLSGRQQWQQHGAYALDSLIFDWQERKLQVQGLSITDLDSGNTEMYLPLLRMSDFDLQLLADSATLILDKLILQNPRWRSTTRLKDNHADTGQIKRLLPLTLPFKRLRISHVYLNQGNIGLSIHREGIEQTINAEGLSVRLQDFRIDTSATNTTSPISFFTHIRLLVKDLQYNIPEYKVKMEARQAEYSSKTKRLDLNGLHYIGHRNKMLSEIKAHRQLLYLSEFKARHIGITDLTAEALLTGKIRKVAMVSVRDPYLAIFLDSTRIEGASTDGSNRLPIPAITCNILKLENASVDLYNALKTGRKYGTARGVDINVSRLQTDIIRSGTINFLKSMERFSFNIESLKLDTLGNIKTLSAKNMAYNSQTGKIGGQDVRLIWSNRQMEVSALGRLLEGEQFNLVKSLATRNLYANNLKLVGPEVEIRTSSSANLSSTNSIKTPGIQIGETEIQNGQFAVYRRDTTLLEAINLNAHLKGLMTAFDTLTKRPELQLQSGRISVDRINALLDKGGHKLTIGGIRATSSDSSLRLDYLNLRPVFGIERPTSNVLADIRTKDVLFYPVIYTRKNVLADISAALLYVCNPDIKIAITTDSSGAPNKSFLKEQPLRAISKITGISTLRIDSSSLDMGSLVIDYAVLGRTDRHWRFFAPRFDMQVESTDIHRNVSEIIKSIALHTHYSQLKNEESEQNIFTEYFHYVGLDDKLYLQKSRIDLNMWETETQRKKYNVNGSLQGLEMSRVTEALHSTNDKRTIASLHLQQPVLHISQFHKQTDFISRELEVKPLMQADSAAAAGLLIEDFGIQKGQLSWIFTDTAIEPVVLRDLSVYSKQLQSGTKAIPTYEYLHLEAGEFSRNIADDYYRFFVKSMSFDSREKFLRFGGVQLIPTYDIFEFAQKAGWEKTRLEIKVASIEARGFDERKLVESQEINIRALNSDSLWVRSFKDKRFPRRERMLPLPSVLLTQLPWTVRIDTAFVTRGNIHHHQISAEGTKAGRLRFENLTAIIDNITNNPADIAKNPKTSVLTHFKLQGSGDISAAINFNLRDPLGGFTAEAQMSEMDLTSFNEYLEPVAFTSVRSGNTKSMKLKMNANDEFAFGEMVLNYDNLKIDVLNKEKTDARGLGIAVKTFLANSVVNTRNPRWLLTKTGDIYYERDTAKEIFHYLGRAALSGAVSSIGVDKNKKMIRQIKRERIKEAKARRKEDENLIESEE